MFVIWSHEGGSPLSILIREKLRLGRTGAVSYTHLTLPTIYSV